MIFEIQNNAAYVEQGYQSGYTQGNSEGYKSGYSQGSADGYTQGAESSKVQIICLGQLGNNFNLTTYKEYKNFKVGTNIFFVPSGISVTVTNVYSHDQTGTSSNDNVMYASKTGTNGVLLNYDANSGILTTSTIAQTGNAMVKEYDGHGYNFDVATANASVTLSGYIYLIY